MGNGPDTLSHHDNLAEHGPATYESNQGDESFMVDSNSHLGLIGMCLNEGRTTETKFEIIPIRPLFE